MVIGVKPKVSVIVPVYNVENFLRRCMDSLISQAFKDIEIIAINDGSTDKSLEILREYEEIDSRVKVIDKLNEGLSQTRNIGIDLAKGDYITFVDSDDWINKDMIKCMYEICKNKECDVAISSYIREYENGSKPKIYDLEKIKIYNEESTRNELYRRIIGPIGNELGKPEHLDSLVMACAKMYKASIIKENNIKFIDTNVIGTEDCLFNIYVFSKVKKAIFINEGFYHYWKGNKNSLTTKYRANLKEQWLVMYDYIKELLDENEENEIFYIALKNRICMSSLGLGLNECSDANLISEFKKVENIKSILNESYIKEAFKELDLKYFPIHWKCFYFFNKNRMALPSYFLLRSINVLRKYV